MNDSPPSPPASRKSRKKGAAERTAKAQGNRRPRARGNGGVVAAGKNRLRPGASCRGHPQEPGCPCRARGGRPLAEFDSRCRRRSGRWPKAQSGDRTFRQGDRKLPAGPVPLLRRGGPAADQQRLGAVVRIDPASRATLHRTQGRQPERGAARVGAGGGRLGHSRSNLPRRGVGPGTDRTLAHRANPAGASTPNAGATTTFPPQSSRILAGTRRRVGQAGFADLVFFTKVVSPVCGEARCTFNTWTGPAGVRRSKQTAEPTKRGSSSSVS